MGVNELRAALAEELEPFVGGEGFRWRVSTGSFVRTAPGVVAQLVIEVERSRFREEYSLGFPLAVRHHDVEIAYHRIVGTEQSLLEAGVSPAETRRRLRTSASVLSSWDRTARYAGITMVRPGGSYERIVRPARLADRALPWLAAHSDRSGLCSALESRTGIAEHGVLERRQALHLADGDPARARSLALGLLADPPFAHDDPAGLAATCTRVVDETT